LYGQKVEKMFEKSCVTAQTVAFSIFEKILLVPQEKV